MDLFIKFHLFLVVLHLIIGWDLVVVLHYSKEISQIIFINFYGLELWFMNFSLNLFLKSLLELYLGSDSQSFILDSACWNKVKVKFSTLNMKENI
jgi:hypothetical protein